MFGGKSKGYKGGPKSKSSSASSRPGKSNFSNAKTQGKSKSTSGRTSGKTMQKPKIIIKTAKDILNAKAEDITRIYRVPGGQYQTKEQVIRAFGYELEKELDAGAFGKIFIGNDLRKKIKVAAKQIDLGLGSENSPQMQDTKNELIIMEKVRHPYVVQVFCHFVVMSPDYNYMYCFMQLADGGNLYKFLGKTGTIDESRCQLYYAQILCGINHMHGLKIAHRDIKLQNILLQTNAQSISGDYILLVADFGLSNINEVDPSNGRNPTKCQTICGTPVFMAPEIIEEVPYNAFLADVWALGIALYMMVCSLEIPFNLRAPKQAILEQMRKKEYTIKNTAAPASANLKGLLSSMLEPMPMARVALVQVINHPWIKVQYDMAHAVSDALKLG